MFATHRERMKKCMECSRLPDCPILNLKASDMPPEEVKRWLRKNCPDWPELKRRIKFVPIHG